MRHGLLQRLLSPCLAYQLDVKWQFLMLDIMSARCIVAIRKIAVQHDLSRAPSFEASGYGGMRQTCMNYLAGGPGTPQITPAGGRRDVDFKHMLQTNGSTGIWRHVALRLHIPPA